MRSFYEYINLTEGKNNKKPYGYLLAIDLYECNSDLVKNGPQYVKPVKKFLIDLVKELKMDVASEPVAYMSDASDIKKYPEHVGVSAFIALVQSGVMLHTQSKQRYASLDVFSCSEFDPNLITTFLEEQFQTKKIMKAFITRGTEYAEERKITNWKL